MANEGPAGYDAARSEAALFDVSDRGKVAVTGKEAAFFLHNLSTNDVKNLKPGAGCELFLATLKAKAVAHGYLYHQPDDGTYWFDLPPSQAERVVQHLDHFLISEQVEFADRTAEFSQFHLAGPRVPEVLRQTFPELPELGELQMVLRPFGAGRPCQVRRHSPLGGLGYDVVCPSEQAGDVSEKLVQAGARPGSRDAYEVLRIEAGTPVYGVDIDDNNLVMEVGRTKQAICYTKGCFLGQEPIVRARDIGHVNRTLLGVRIAGEAPVPRGAKLFRAGQEAGQVTSSAWSPRLGTVIGLAYVRRGSQEPGTVLEVEAEGGRRTAEVASLPFSGA